MHSVTKIMNFEYGHRILNHPGKCKRLHGHSGKLELTVLGPINQETGMIIDFGDINGTIGEWVKDILDHKTILQYGDPLFETLPTTDTYTVQGPPTAENISNEILRHCELMELSRDYNYKVRLWETEDSYAECSS